jgi:phosphoserine/homoserine phosphotransferase
MMHLVCLDLEGVLVPEIWKAVARLTGIEALNRTTRDEPDYDKLMRFRLDLLGEHGITLPRIHEAITTLAPLEGAVAFIHWLRAQTRVIILSDTFVEFAEPLMRQLDYPTLLCHSLEVGADGRITGYRLRQPDQKRKAVEAFRGLNLNVIAAGDSFNDLTMLEAADQAILFRPAEGLPEQYPGFPVTQTHDELRAAIEAAFASA